VKRFQFWDKTGLPAGGKLWFFHPLAFIRHFRKCGWLSANELASTLPKYPYYKYHNGHYVAVTDVRNAIIKLSNSLSRTASYVTELNRSMRKNGIIDNRNRQIQFLGQILLETDIWNTVAEYDFGKYNPKQPATEYYAAFYGRGLLQMTWAGLYEAYGDFRRFPENSGGVYQDPRITKISTHWFGDPRHRDKHHNIVIVGIRKLWYPRYDPDVILSSPDLVCDCAGFFWVHKHHRGARNINRVADSGVSPDSISRVSVLVNGGANGFYERQAFGQVAARALLDSVDGAQAETFNPANRQRITVNFSRPEE
jgi:hypothetical protein